MSLFEAVSGQTKVTAEDQRMRQSEAERSEHIPTVAREVFDVTGAGDTVVAVSTLALAAGASMLDSARIANCAAGIVVGKVGTVSVTAEELRESLLWLSKSDKRSFQF